MDLNKRRGDAMGRGRGRNEVGRPMDRKVLAGALTWVVLLAAVALLPQSEPQAQSSPTPPSFCYTGASGQPQCFDAQSKAEAALRAEPVPGGALAQWRPATAFR